MDPRALLLETLEDLIRINSVNPHFADGRPEEAVQAYVESFLARYGMQTVRQPLEPGRENVIGILPGAEPGRRIIFEAHCDTVAVAGMEDAFEPRREGNRLYGRGACDVKGGLAAMLCALASLKQRGVTPPAEVWVVSAVDEEHAYRGVLRLLEDGLTADAAIVAEPTELRMIIASKGCLRWRTVLEGRSAHSSKPHLGVNAIDAMARLIVALEDDGARLAERRHPLLGPATLTVARIEGGEQINIVPDRCAIEIDRRLIPGETPDEVLDSYRHAFRQWLDGRDVKVNVEPPFVVDLPLETAPAAAVARVAGRVLDELGLDPEPIGVAFGSDASKLAAAGIPSIILGPGSIDRAHTVEEYVEIDQLEASFEIYRLFMERFSCRP